jgi:photolyase PhrII
VPPETPHPFRPEDLPPHLAERTRALAPDRPPRDRGTRVVYWLRTALRGHENPALDVARAAAVALDRPLLVYQGLSERYRWASDRHHRFILEGARDVHEELAAAGVASAFHLERPGHRQPALLELAADAALIVTEDFPVEPMRRWTAALCERTEAPVWAVDAACVAPMARIPAQKAQRAGPFRRAARPWHEGAARPWPAVPDVPSQGPADAPADPLADLPFEPVDLTRADLGALIACCAIDHGVAPVPGETGGSRAGYARWEAFRTHRLGRYRSDRNDPLKPATSRLSPYLHYGMVSPFRIAREAALAPGAGADKFLDELLVWREVAWAFCFHERDPDALSALPPWARETLAAHADDPRDALPGWETLARGRTGDALWDAAQRSLLAHGELHNNLRMTWGKQLLRWTRSPEAALRMLLDLNHRYALDGRDPSSYGGLLWCLGGLDRPFTPEVPILGTVRPRSTAQHAERLDVDRYAARTARNRYRSPRADGAPLRVAVLGAGPAGLTAARVLADHNVAVTVLDKGRRPGGRLATRTSRTRPGVFDHGTAFLCASDRAFAGRLDGWARQGLLERWEPRLRDGDAARLEAHVAGFLPGPNGAAAEPLRNRNGGPRLWRSRDEGLAALGAHLAADLDVRTGVTVGTVIGAPGELVLEGADGTAHGPFDAVLVTLPPPQARNVLPDDVARALPEAESRPCWSLFARLDRDPGFDLALPADGPFERLHVRSRGDGCDLVAQARAEWSREHLEAEPDAVAGALRAPLEALLGASVPGEGPTAHRWRYAAWERPTAQCEEGPGGSFGAVPGAGVWLAGDAWLPGAEGALRSGRAAAGHLLGVAFERGPAEPEDEAPVERDQGELFPGEG